MNEITTVGVDLAKEVIVVCAGDAEGRAVFFRQFSFAGFAEWAANLPPCLIGIEACSSALQTVLGIGHITASALLATIANPRDFRNGRQLSAWCGLVPRQHSSGGKARLGVITKRGDAYLRGLLTQGARSTLQAARKREPLRRSRLEHRIVALHDRVGYHKTLVAVANKHLRTVWAILAHHEDYDPNAWRRHPRAARCA